MGNIYAVYNYYRGAINPKPATKYDAHKHSDLSDLYDHMLQLDKHTPLYMLRMTPDIQKFVLGIKDAAVGLKNVMNYLSDSSDEVFNKVEILSSDPSSVTASLMDSTSPDIPARVPIQVHTLAAVQKNAGALIPSSDYNIPPGIHSLTAELEEETRTLALHVYPGSSNLTVQKDLASLINQSDLGIKASLASSGPLSAIDLESTKTGLIHPDQTVLFRFRSNPISNTNLSDFLDMNDVIQYPSNAHFTLNGIDQEAPSNSITLNQALKLTFLKPSGDEVLIETGSASHAIRQELTNFTAAYNHFLDLAETYRQSQPGAVKLAADIKQLTAPYNDDLAAAGILRTEAGHLELEEHTFHKALQDGSVKELFTSVSRFQDDLNQRINHISLNPLEYARKKIVTYPNPASSYPSPYQPSMYTGLLFSYYL